jgi:hypothetical protein
MRQFIVAAAIALGLIAVWAVILPLTAQPAPVQTNATTAAMSKALFLCRGANGIDRACAAMLAKALVLDATDTTATHVTGRFCPVDRQRLVSLESSDQTK